MIALRTRIVHSIYISPPYDKSCLIYPCNLYFDNTKFDPYYISSFFYNITNSMNDFILLENCKHPSEPSYSFQEPSDEIICFESKALSGSLQKIDMLRKQNKYLAGFISYEAGLALNGIKLRDNQTFPLLHFLAFKKPTILRNTITALEESYQNKNIWNIELQINERNYLSSIEQIKQYLFSGDCYQINFTSKYKFEYQDDIINLFQLLKQRQKVEYAAILNFKNYQILSFSPELFFRKTKNKLITKPMKGTMPRHINPDLDRENKAFLTTDPKSIAENIMIVDLLRNDMSKLSKPSSVSVTKLLEVESYETVHQMTSTIESEIEEDLSFEMLIKNLFPSGSVTGAPKKRTMEMIQAIEPESRGVYTGCIGYITPENDMCFNVAIRTLLLKHGMGELGVGGGILYDSDPAQEFLEMQLKGKFLTEMKKW
jgi:para-aminobenzoate synthetase/4-amino-4-deoxychorismate lyase